MRKTFMLFIGKSEGRNHFGNLDVGGKITLKWNLKHCGMRTETGLMYHS